MDTYVPRTVVSCTPRSHISDRLLEKSLARPSSRSGLPEVPQHRRSRLNSTSPTPQVPSLDSPADTPRVSGLVRPNSKGASKHRASTSALLHLSSSPLPLRSSERALPFSLVSTKTSYMDQYVVISDTLLVNRPPHDGRQTEWPVWHRATTGPCLHTQPRAKMMPA